MNRLMNRRTWLRGAGVALTLPWMESLAPKLARGQSRRLPESGLLPIFFPNGSANVLAARHGRVSAMRGRCRPSWSRSQRAQEQDARCSPTSKTTRRRRSDDNASNPSHGRDPGVFLSGVDAQQVRDSTLVAWT